MKRFLKTRSKNRTSENETNVNKCQQMKISGAETIFDADPITEHEKIKQMLTNEEFRFRNIINCEEITNCRILFNFVEYNIKKAISTNR